jgi:hypothetical protein
MHPRVSSPVVSFWLISRFTRCIGLTRIRRHLRNEKVRSSIPLAPPPNGGGRFTVLAAYLVQLRSQFCGGGLPGGQVTTIECSPSGTCAVTGTSRSEGEVGRGTNQPHQTV